MAVEFVSLPPEDALAFFRSKLPEVGYSWLDVWQEEHARAFTVAKAMNRDVLEAIAAALDRALAEGITLEQFIAELKPRLEELGWWGIGQEVDPQTGTVETVRLGSPARLRTIFQTNLRSAYAVGKWERVQRTKAAFPYLRYVAVRDRRTRPAHRLWSGTILPVDHPWWDQHFPPCGWNCRCQAVQLDERQMARRGWTVTDVPPSPPSRDHVNRRTGEVSRIEGGIDPGFGFNIGKAYLAGLSPRPIGGDLAGPVEASLRAGEAGDAFLREFGLERGQERVWRDPAGWPLALGPGWFRTAGGRTARFGREEAAALPLAARALLAPAEIRWVWRRGLDGRPILVRRYLAAVRASDGAARVPVVVDVANVGWQFATPATDPAFELARLRVGHLAWSLGEEVAAGRGRALRRLARRAERQRKLAGLSRSQRAELQDRDAGGRFTGPGTRRPTKPTADPVPVASQATLRRLARRALADKQLNVQLALPPPRDLSAIEAVLGRPLAGFKRTIDSRQMRHAIKQHGKPKPKRGKYIKHVPLKRRDLALVNEVYRRAGPPTLHPRRHSAEPDSLQYDAKIDGLIYSVVEHVQSGQKRLAFQTMFKNEG